MSQQEYVSLHGVKYQTVFGRVKEAHEKGFVGKRVDILIKPHETPDNSCTVKVTVLFKTEADELREFEAIGDASPSNVGPTIKKSFIRMAETRALGRALGVALGLAEPTSEEHEGQSMQSLKSEDGSQEEKPKSSSGRSKKKPAPGKPGSPKSEQEFFEHYKLKKAEAKAGKDEVLSWPGFQKVREAGLNLDEVFKLDKAGAKEVWEKFKKENKK